MILIAIGTSLVGSAATGATLSIQKRGVGIGTVTASISGLHCSEGADSCRATYPNGTQLQLTAAPSLDSAFGGWSGACSGTSPCTLTLNSDVTVGAAFDPATVTAVVPSSGGQVVLGGLGNVRLPAGTFPGSQTITLTSTRRPETRVDFNTTAILFNPAGRSLYELRISTGAAPPAGPVEVTLAIPEVLVAMSVTHELYVMAQMYSNGGSEVVDTFEPMTSTQGATTVLGSLPPQVFTNARTLDRSYEAIVVLAALPTRPAMVVASSAPRMSSQAVRGEKMVPLPGDVLSKQELTQLIEGAATDPCRGASLGEPIAGGAPVTSPFNPAAPHRGTDYGVPNGTPVQAMADGEVIAVRFQPNQSLPRPDGRTGLSTRSWGQYIAVKHADGSASLYAHLDTDAADVFVQVGQQVQRGDVLALSDNSGSSTNPHLHVEYAPNGQLFGEAGKVSKVDPAPCIGANVNGSITVSDNGTLADDAFTVSINGAQICSTSIGASNTCAANNLRPGTVTLTITCNVAPDDVGTFEISLANGLTFQGGGTTRSGTIPEGSSASFTVIVPTP